MIFYSDMKILKIVYITKSFKISKQEGSLLICFDLTYWYSTIPKDHQFSLSVQYDE